jgi:hypothetical protein
MSVRPAGRTEQRDLFCGAPEMMILQLLHRQLMLVAFDHLTQHAWAGTEFPAPEV